MNGDPRFPRNGPPILDVNKHRQGRARAQSDSVADTRRVEPTGIRGMRPSSREEVILILNNIDPLSGPTSYEVTEPDVLRRQFDPKPPPKTPHTMKWQPVVKMLQEHNNPKRPLNDKERAAVERLKGLGRHSKWYPDIFFKIFLDIDLLFFDSTLRDNVTLLWTMEPDIPALAYVAGAGDSPIIDTPRVGIHLNGSLLVDNMVSFHEAVMIFIHECIHAYIFTHCDAKKPSTWMTKEDIFSKDPGHGTAFELCMEAVQARCGRTRFMQFQKAQHEPGGTVALGTDLRHRWDSEGGFMVDGEREVNRRSSGPESSTIAVMEQIERGDLPRSVHDSRAAAREAAAWRPGQRIPDSGQGGPTRALEGRRDGHARHRQGRGAPGRSGPHGARGWPGTPSWNNHRPGK